MRQFLSLRVFAGLKLPLAVVSCLAAMSNGTEQKPRPDCAGVLGGLLTIEEAVHKGELDSFYLNAFGGPFKTFNRDGWSMWETGIYKSASMVSPIAHFAGDAPLYYTNELTDAIYTVSRHHELKGRFTLDERAVMQLELLKTKRSVLIVGSPASGKTFLLHKVALFALGQGYKVGIIPLDSGIPVADRTLGAHQFDPGKLLHGDESTILGEIADVDLLIVDNFSESSQSLAVSNAITSLMVVRAQKQRPMIVTVQVPKINISDVVSEALKNANLFESTKLLFSQNFNLINENRVRLRSTGLRALP
jgi:DNA replication protein DnaC